jgi:hypothetical protein
VRKAESEVEMKVLTTIPAHFDGTQVRLDVDVEIEPNTRLLVTILGEGSHN